MSAALVALLDLFARLEPDIAGLLVSLFSRLRDTVESQSDQAIFLRVAALVIVRFDADTLLTPADKQVAARDAIVNTLTDLNATVPDLGLIDAFVKAAFVGKE